jgi:hypothetical protein
MVPWEEYRYTIYAREFGWTPAQVDEIPLTIEPWIIPIHSAMNDAERAAMEQARKDAEAKRNGR